LKRLAMQSLDFDNLKQARELIQVAEMIDDIDLGGVGDQPWSLPHSL
jgi:hypothetical protein